MVYIREIILKNIRSFYCLQENMSQEFKLQNIKEIRNYFIKERVDD